MKYLLALIFILCLSTVSAEIAIKEVVDTSKSPAVFSVSTNERLVVTSRVSVGETRFFLNGELIHSADFMNFDEPLTIPVQHTGNYDLEIRALLEDAQFYWESFEVTKNQDPLYIDYVNYIQDKNQIIFAIKGADMIHAKDLDRVGDSVNENLDDYSVVLNSNLQLYCYPKVRTGKALGFSCSSYAFPKTMEVTMTLGFKENHNITLTKNTPTVVPQETEPVLVDENQNQEEEQKGFLNNIQVIDKIVVEQIIPQQMNLTSITITIFLLFLAVFVLFFVASHHKHENRRAGKLHPEKTINKKQ